MAHRRIRIWSDYTCPFCYVGLERADWLSRRYGAEVEWRPYFLHPEVPSEGVLRSDYVGRFDFDAEDVTRQAIEGAGFPYEPPPRIPHSLNALALTELARDRGLHDAVHRRLERAYWSEGQDIGDHQVLLGLAEEAGLAREEAAAALESPGYAERVLSSTLEAQRRGINAIPAFVLDERLLVLGAQPHGIFEEAITLLDTETEAIDVEAPVPRPARVEDDPARAAPRS